MRSLCLSLCRFAHTIGRREYADHLYRVSKDEHQRSHITTEDVLGD